MMFLTLVLLQLLYLRSPVSASPVVKFEGDENHPAFEMSPFSLEVDENGQCIYVKSEEGEYSFTSPGTHEVCGLYFITDPDKRVEIMFETFDISCAKGGLLSVIDGWELNGQFFPSAEDRISPGKNFAEYCGKNKPRKTFLSSQNVGLLEYRIPAKGQGFTVRVRFVDNPKPCNVVLQQMSGTYTLRNYNRRVNCSVSIIFPLTVQILATSIGVQSTWPTQNADVETGLVTKCKKRGIFDFVEVRGGNGLDPLAMNVAIDFCGLDSVPHKYGMVTVACGNTAVRLVSSGNFENSITFSFDLPSDLSKIDLICPSFFGASEFL